MQEAEVGGKLLALPECHDGDKEWIAAMLYNVTTRRHEGCQIVIEPQRTAMMEGYERTYLNSLELNEGHDGPSIARRLANIDLRERVGNYLSLRKGLTVHKY